MTKEYPTLYKRDSKGKVLQWKIEVQNNSGSIDIKKSYGEKGGVQAPRWQRNIQGKNEGKANETNEWEQANKMAESAIKNKKRTGYVSLEDITKNEPTYHASQSLDEVLHLFLTGDNTNLEGHIIPMKAQQYYRSKPNWTDPAGKTWKNRKYYYMLNPHMPKEKGAVIPKFPCLIQPKINGVRCTAQLINGEVKLYSKKGLEYQVPHIIDYFNINIDLFKWQNHNIIFDGELYIHGESLQEIGSAVDKFNFNSPRLKYVVFDLAIANVTNIERLHILKSMKTVFDLSLNCPIERIKTLMIKSDQAVQKWTDTFIEQGYEGSIIRNIEGLYQFDKRPQDMTKLKRLMDEEFEIIDIIPQEKDPSLGLYLCRTKKGLEVKVTPTGTEDFKREILFDKSNYIGKQLTCWFYEWTDKGLPFHIVNNIIRDYE